VNNHLALKGTARVEKFQEPLAFMWPKLKKGLSKRVMLRSKRHNKGVHKIERTIMI